ncbi:hypothetical protein STEG23_034664 [Scotinomys teguina]
MSLDLPAEQISFHIYSTIANLHEVRILTPSLKTYSSSSINTQTANFSFSIQSSQKRIEISEPGNSIHLTKWISVIWLENKIIRHKVFMTGIAFSAPQSFYMEPRNEIIALNVPDGVNQSDLELGYRMNLKSLPKRLEKALCFEYGFLSGSVEGIDDHSNIDRNGNREDYVH